MDEAVKDKSWFGIYVVNRNTNERLRKELEIRESVLVFRIKQRIVTNFGELMWYVEGEEEEEEEDII